MKERALGVIVYGLILASGLVSDGKMARPGSGVSRYGDAVQELQECATAERTARCAELPRIAAVAVEDDGFGPRLVLTAPASFARLSSAERQAELERLFAATRGGVHGRPRDRPHPPQRRRSPHQTALGSQPQEGVGQGETIASGHGTYPTLRAPGAKHEHSSVARRHAEWTRTR